MTAEEWKYTMGQLRRYGTEQGIEHVLEKYNLDATVFPALSYMSDINALAGMSIYGRSEGLILSTKY